MKYSILAIVVLSTVVSSKHSRQMGSYDSTEEDNNVRMNADSKASDGSAVRGWNEKEQIWDDWVRSWEPTGDDDPDMGIIIRSWADGSGKAKTKAATVTRKKLESKTTRSSRVATPA
jgi:hypothetical protein